MKRAAAVVLVLGICVWVLRMAVPAPCWAKDPINKSWLGYAIKGYDPVAYFTEGRPVKGSKDFLYKYMGAKWLFTSEEHRDMFRSDPDKYSPQYGGYCAWAVGHNEIASGNPNIWKIVDGKLYLNYNKSVHEQWEQDIPGWIKKADRYWPDVLKK